jgi:hypothetical protein
MSRAAEIVNLLPAIPLVLVHLAGVVVAIALLVRQKGEPMPAVLALMGFGLLFLLDLANFARGPLINFVIHRVAQGVRLNPGPRSVVPSVGCCCSIFEVVAGTCLIIAIWQAMSDGKREGAARKL